MRPTPRLLSGGGNGPLDTKNGEFLGPWGNLGSPTQKGITSYALAANRQRPLAGTLHAAVFNTWRRFRAQVLYIAPPMLIAYGIMSWAIERNRYLNSKEGRMAEAEAEAAKEATGPVRG